MIHTFLKVAVATAAFALLHSGLASLPAQDWAVRRFGSRQRNGLYRSFYIGQSLLSLAALWTYVRRLPDRALYRAPASFSWLLRLGQAAGLGYAVYAASLVGIERITGLRSLLAWLRPERDKPVPAEPAAQGPSPNPSGRLNTTGIFAWSRHPLNFAPLPVFWLNPVMTVQLLAFNLVATLYLVLGSVHEEHRLLAAYGEQYSAYQHSGVPFYWPNPWPKLT